MSVWKSVGQNMSGLAKHVVQSMVSEPMEVAKNAVGQSDTGHENQAMEAMEQGSAQQSQQTQQQDDVAKSGFKTQDDFQKYQGLSGQKDQLEMAAVRRALQSEWGLEPGIQRARAEFEDKERQRKEVKEQEKEQKKQFEFEKKKQDDIAIQAAKAQGGAENKAWGAG